MTAARGDGGVGLFLVMAAAALWATVGVATQIMPAAAGLPPDAMGLTRMAVAGALLLAVAFTTHGRAALWPCRLNVGVMVRFAVSGTVFQLCLFRCFPRLGVTLAVFVTVCLPPVLAMLWAVLRRTEAPTGGMIAAFALAVAGLAAMTQAASGGGSSDVSLTGLLYAVVASVAFVSLTSATHSLTTAAPPILVAGTGLAASGVVLLVLLAVTSPSSLAVAAAGLQDRRIVALPAYLGIGPTALAYLCYCAGIARCSSACAGLIASMVEPAIAALLAAWLLGERLVPATAIGCGLLMCAMAVLWWRSAPARPRPCRPASATPPTARGAIGWVGRGPCPAPVSR